MKRLSLLLFLLLLAAEAVVVQAEAVLRVRRQVHVDKVAAPNSDAPNPTACCTRQPKAGQVVELLVAEGKALRREPSLSFLLDADAQRLYVIYPQEESYIELGLPFDDTCLHPPLRKRLGLNGDGVFGVDLASEVAHGAGRAAGLETVRYEATMDCNFSGGFQTAVDYAEPFEDPASVAYQLEVLVQKLRLGGESWLDQLPRSSGLPVSLKQNARLPEAEARYEEIATEVGEAEVPDGSLAIPAGYVRNPWPGDCAEAR